jgi:gliding motility-associated-like protein
LGSVNLDVATPGRITITWDSPTALTLPLSDTTLLLKLEFETKKAGEAALTWVFPPTDYVECDTCHLKVTGLVPSKVIIYENPLLSMQPAETCVGSPVTLSANISPPDSYTYLWTWPNGFTETGSQITISNPDTSNTGTFDLIVTNPNGCSDASTTSLIVHPLPAHGFVKDDSLYFDFPDTLEALPGFDSYLWMDDQTTQGIMIQDSGYYSVTVTDGFGCANTFEIFANSNYEKPFFYRIPSAFTPNGDGLNDSFRPFTDYELIKKFHLVIFNRWGQMVFQTDDSMKGWDGKVNGVDALAGPYGWSIVYSNYHKFNVKAKGIVWVVR